MKTINKLLSLLLMATVALVGCNRDFDAPPLEKPVYNGPEENMTIKELKNIYSDVTSDAPRLVEVDYILKARVISSDESGNIFKQLYIYDESGYGINMGVDQNSLYTEYYIGQEVFVDLHGLYIVNYGDQLQIGMANTQANRIPFKTFQEHVSKNGWPKPDAVKPAPLKFTELEDRMVNTLVTFDNVYFADGGKLPYVDGTQTTNRDLKFVDGEGVVLVRTSSFANFAKETLPKGKGTVTGILSKFRTDWQLTILNKEDVKNFDGSDITETKPEPVEGTLFLETFGPTFQKGDKPWPKIADYTEFDNKNVKFTDSFGAADIRSYKGANYTWLPANKDSELKVENIDLSKTNGKDITLTYKLMANLYNATDKGNSQDIVVIYNGKELSVPNIALDAATDKDIAKEIKISGLQPSANATITFAGKSDKNKLGFRVGAVQFTIGDGSGTIDPTEPTDPTNPTDPTDPTDPTGPVEPVEGLLYKESFATGKVDFGKNNRPKIADFKDQDAKGVTYTDPTGNADIRSYLKVNYVWLPANKDSEFNIEGLKLSSGKNIELSYDLMPNLYGDGEDADIATIEVYVDGVKQDIKSQILTAPGDKDKVVRIVIKNVPAKDNLLVSFKGLADTNKRGYRLGNIEIASK